MRLITRNTDYAIRAVCFMAKMQDKLANVSELVEELKIPGPFLRKILQELNKKGILESSKGQGGGFQLAMKPQKISVLDICEAFQDPLKLNECFFKKIACPNKKTCNLRSQINKIEELVFSELNKIKIPDLIKVRKNV